MYKVLLVEDEEILREGVSEELETMGVFAVDTAANGVEALERTAECPYDAIIMDIRMPKMDGMELLKALHEAKNDAVKVIMSGYADFHYAQKGIEYGVADYVVKPLPPDRICSMGEKIHAMLQERQEKNEQEALLRVKAEGYTPIWGDMIFTRMVNGEYSGEETENRLRAHDMVFGEDPITVVLLYPVKEGERPGAEEGAVFRISADTVAVVLQKEEDAAVEFARQYAETCGGIICAVGSEQTGSERLKEAYMNAEEALRYAQLMERSGVIRNGDVKSSGSNIFLDELELRMLLALAKKEELKEWVGRLFEEIPLEASRQEYYSLAIYIAMVCQKNVRRLSAEKASIVIDYENVLKLRTRKEMRVWMEALVDTACDQIRGNARHRSALEVEKTKTYIDEHLSEDISMTALAKNAYLSPNYLGKLFYEKLGMSISEYINMRRMERACELIRCGNAKIYEIAEMVGIRDPNYFSSIFKKVIGVSPKEYKSFVGAQEREERL